MSEQKPIIGITIGDAAGIGPEITLKAISDKTSRAKCRVVLICDAGHMRRLAAKLGVALDDIEIVDLNNLPTEFEIGVDAAVTGKASAEYIVKAVELWREGKIDAICTAPISKKAIALGGYNYPGHTEFIAELTNTGDFRMSFFAEKLRVVLLSTHLPLTKAIERVKTAALVDLIGFANREIGKLLGRERFSGGNSLRGGHRLGGRKRSTSGGLLGEAYIHGMNGLTECVRQIRGTATLQVPDATVCLVSNQGGTMHTHATLLLGH